jgi:hypothetical protein
VESAHAETAIVAIAEKPTASPMGIAAICAVVSSTRADFSLRDGHSDLD